MNILITGNMGYIGPVLARILKNNISGCRVIGYDTGFFAPFLSSKTRLPETYIDAQYFGDTRDITKLMEPGIDAVVHLAAVSNDPMGNQFAAVTHQINCEASVELAKLCSRSGVKNFVFASSCSMYGLASNSPRKEADAKNPLTAYAISKQQTEEMLANEDLGDMLFTSLRFATACGWSNRIRLDLVLNDFVASAIASREIKILSDGTPWRPLIDVEDMARAMLWGATRKISNGGEFLCINAGKDDSNYQIKDLALEVQKALPDSNVLFNKDAQPDKRSYRVDFSLFRELAPEFQPKVTLAQSIEKLILGFKLLNFQDRDFRNSTYIRLIVLKQLISCSELGDDLRWMESA